MLKKSVEYNDLGSLLSHILHSIRVNNQALFCFDIEVRNVQLERNCPMKGTS